MMFRPSYMTLTRLLRLSYLRGCVACDIRSQIFPSVWIFSGSPATTTPTRQGTNQATGGSCLEKLIFDWLMTQYMCWILLGSCSAVEPWTCLQQLPRPLCTKRGRVASQNFQSFAHLSDLRDTNKSRDRDMSRETGGETPNVARIVRVSLLLRLSSRQGIGSKCFGTIWPCTPHTTCDSTWNRRHLRGGDASIMSF